MARINRMFFRRMDAPMAIYFSIGKRLMVGQNYCSPPKKTKNYRDR